MSQDSPTSSDSSRSPTLAEIKASLEALPKDAPAEDRAKLITACIASHPEPDAVLKALFEKIAESDKATPRMKEAANAFLAALSEPGRRQDV